MATDVLSTDQSYRHDPRESGQERASGTMDLDGDGAGSIEVDLTGRLDDIGVGLFGTAAAGDGDASLGSLSPDSVTVSVANGTANQENVEWQLVVSEDPFYRDTSGDLSGGDAP